MGTWTGTCDGEFFSQGRTHAVIEFDTDEQGILEEDEEVLLLSKDERRASLDSSANPQCDGEERENEWEEVGEVLRAAGNLHGSDYCFSVWHNDRYQSWVAGMSGNDYWDYPHSSGDTPLEAAQNLLHEVKKRKGLLVDPHGEEWDGDKCREWLDERGRLKEMVLLNGDIGVSLCEDDTFREIATADAHSRLEALRDLVVAVYEKGQEE